MVTDGVWAVALAAAGATFVVLEGRALLRRERTLSAFLRRLAGIDPRRPWRPVGIAVIAGFCAWLASHLIFGV
ncbi:hypothetical protein [Streptomyces himalayensis]|uniref:Uncharacterized protein n=1 Tax=Streptomyces himalayensis subsp. himalayensis TaxID=2756131 RepID=A0A7W0ID79_9ACTN|nr:hypothetical protein [Streptomyces himalayensis]MBA2951423.1 hypothetical protein [Streptomyces himalayensis subsp. himalayensis]